MHFHASLEFLQFELFVEEADLVEGVEDLEELSWVVFDEFFEGLIAIYEFEEGVVHDEVIEEDLLLLFLPLGLCILLLDVSFVGFFPKGFELVPIDELFAFDSNALLKHVGVSAQLEGLLDLSHLPLEFIIEILYLFRNQLFKNAADLLEFLLVLFEVKLEGTV